MICSILIFTFETKPRKKNCLIIMKYYVIDLPIPLEGI